MKKLFFALLVAMICLPLGAQTIKLKKDQVLVDKVPVLQFPQASGKGLSAKDCAILSMDGDTLIVFNAVEVVYDQLPYEKEPRCGGFYAEVDLRFINRKEVITYWPRYFQTRIVDCMKNSGILTSDGLQADMADAFIKELRPEQGEKKKADLLEAGRVRAQIAADVELTYRRHEKRTPSLVPTVSEDKITESGKMIGTWRKDDSEDGLNYHAMINRGNMIATIIHDPGNNKLVVRTFDEKEYVMSCYESEISNTYKSEVAQYLLNYGYL